RPERHPIVGPPEFSTGYGEEPLSALAQPAQVERSGGRPTLVAGRYAYFGYESVIHPPAPRVSSRTAVEGSALPRSRNDKSMNAVSHQATRRYPTPFQSNRSSIPYR